MSGSMPGGATARRRTVHLIGAACALSAAVPAAAQETRSGIDVRIGGEVASNPYLETGAAEVTAAASGELRPWILLQDERTRYSIEGFVQGRAFADEYEFEDNYGVNMAASHRSSERLSLTARAGAFSTASRLSSLLDGIDPGGGPSLPGANPGDDVTVFGSRGRTNNVTAGVGAEYAFDARNRMQLDAGYENYWFERPGALDYQSYTAQASYSRVLSAVTSIGTVLSYRTTNYRRTALGDGRTVSAMASLNRRLDAYWTLDASAGVAFSESQAPALPPGTTVLADFTTVTVRASLCRRDPRRNLCVEYSRIPEPTALGGIRNSDEVVFTMSERVSERDTLRLSGTYTSNGEAITATGLSRIEYYSAQATYDRRISERLSGFVSGSAAKISRSDLSIDPSVTVGAGITLHLGQRR